MVFINRQPRGIPMRTVSSGGVAPTYYYRIPIMNYQSAGAGYINTATTFVTPGGTLATTSASTTRETTEIEIGASGYIKKLRCFVIGTTLAAPATIKLYVNGVDQSATHSVTVSASTAGAFEMATDDGFAVVAGDLVTMEIVRSEGSNLAFANIGFDYLTTTGNIILNSAGSGIYNNATGQLRFQGLTGANGQVATSTDITRIKIPTACTIKRISGYVTTNTRLTLPTDFYIRINGTTTALSFSVAGSATNIRTSTTGSVSVSAGDDLEFCIDGGNEAGTITWTSLSVELEPTVAGETPFVFGYGATAITAGTSRFHSGAGQGTGFSTSETNSTTKFNKGGTASNLYTYCASNAAVNDSTYTFRSNSTDTSLAITYLGATSETGIKSDLVDTATIADGDLVTVRLTQGAGTAGNFFAGWLTYKLDITPETVSVAQVAPVATAATLVYGIAFTANWNASAGATSYHLDVSADNFATFVSGFNDLDVSSATTYIVTGLSASTAYKYRVRAVGPSGTSANSNVIDVSTVALTTETFTTATTWEALPGLGFAVVRAWGGGGGGGGSGATDNRGGGGGAGGAFAESILSVVPTTIYTIAVAAGGSGGLASGTGGTGGTGGNSWFNTTGTIIARGGVGGVGGNAGATGGLGSTASCIGDTLYRGGNGADGLSGSYSGGGGGGAGSTGAGGDASTTTAGTGTTLSGGGGGAGQSTGAPGGAGSNYGGGGGGGYRTPSINRIGGAGAQGLVTISY